MPPITGPAVANYCVLSNPHSTFRFGLQEGKCESFPFFSFCLFSFILKVHVTQLGINVPIISDEIGATVS